MSISMAALALGLVLLTIYAVDRFTRFRGTLRLLHLFVPHHAGGEELDVRGKYFIVTGGNSGLGLGTCRALAEAGGHVVLACRSLERGEAAKQSSITSTSASAKGSIRVMELDLSDLRSVKRFVREYKQLKLPLHSLVLNAGVMMCPFELTRDGIESQFAINHVGHFALAKDLLGVLEQTDQSSVVCVSSVAHWFTVPGGVHLSLDRINNPDAYDSALWYGQSKLANLLFARELGKRSPKVMCNAIHPGAVQGNLNRHLVGTSRALHLVDNVVQRALYWPADTAALTPVFAAVMTPAADHRTTRKYFVPVARMDDGSDLARNDELAAKLWDFTESVLKAKQYDLM